MYKIKYLKTFFFQRLYYQYDADNTGSISSFELPRVLGAAGKVAVEP